MRRPPRAFAVVSIEDESLVVVYSNVFGGMSNTFFDISDIHTVPNTCITIFVTYELS